MMKNTNPKYNESHALKKKALNLLSKAIAKIIIKFRLPRNEFLSLFDEKLVLEAQRLDPTASHVALAIRTGIDRRYISKYLKGEMPRAKPDKLSVILEDIRWTAHKYYNSTKIPKLGPFKTFQSICEQRASGSLTYQAILDELVENGNLRDLGEKIELVNLKIDTKQNEVSYTHISALQINRLVDTVIFNSTKKNKQDKLIQRTIYSTQVHPKNFDILHMEFEKILAITHRKISETIISLEEDVEVDTYPQYGLSFLEYKTEE